MKLIKKNIIPSILEAIGYTMVIFTMRFGIIGFIDGLWVYLTIFFASFIGFLLINIGIKKYLRDI